MSELSQKAKEARRRYYRHYRQSNEKKIKEAQKRYWEKKAAEFNAKVDAERTKPDERETNKEAFDIYEIENCAINTSNGNARNIGANGPIEYR